MEELVIIVYHVLNICFYNQHLIHAFSIVVLWNILNILQKYVYYVIFNVKAVLDQVCSHALFHVMVANTNLKKDVNNVIVHVQHVLVVKMMNV